MNPIDNKIDKINLLIKLKKYQYNYYIERKKSKTLKKLIDDKENYILYLKSQLVDKENHSIDSKNANKISESLDNRFNDSLISTYSTDSTFINNKQHKSIDYLKSPKKERELEQWLDEASSIVDNDLCSKIDYEIYSELDSQEGDILLEKTIDKKIDNGLQPISKLDNYISNHNKNNEYDNKSVDSDNSVNTPIYNNITIKKSITPNIFSKSRIEFPVIQELTTDANELLDDITTNKLNQRIKNLLKQNIILKNLLDISNTIENTLELANEELTNMNNLQRAVLNDWSKIIFKHRYEQLDKEIDYDHELDLYLIEYKTNKHKSKPSKHKIKSNKSIDKLDEITDTNKFNELSSIKKATRIRKRKDKLKVHNSIDSHTNSEEVNSYKEKLKKNPSLTTIELRNEVKKILLELNTNSSR